MANNYTPIDYSTFPCHAPTFTCVYLFLASVKWRDSEIERAQIQISCAVLKGKTNKQTKKIVNMGRTKEYLTKELGWH